MSSWAAGCRSPLRRDLAEIGRPSDQVGVTRYPVSHPTISDDLTVQATWDKRVYMTHMVSNLTFDPKAVRARVARLRARGLTEPSSLVDGLHVFTFNQIAETEAWRNDLLRRLRA